MKVSTSVVATLPVMAVLRVTVVVVALVSTVVPLAIFVPSNVIPWAIPSVADAPENVSVVPDLISALGVAVIGEFPELNVIGVVVVTPGPVRASLIVTVVTVSTLVTVVSGAIFVPLTGMPAPIPIAVPPKVSVFRPVSVVWLGLAVNGGIR